MRHTFGADGIIEFLLAPPDPAQVLVLVNVLKKVSHDFEMTPAGSNLEVVLLVLFVD